MKTIRVAGVPEHFNFPWKSAIEDGLFESARLNVRWTDVPQGTGRMCEMLRNDETDLAIVLTEGIVRDIALGNPSCIVQVYVESPLLWGIHVRGKSDIRDTSELQGKTVAISRFGSGSHLMAVVHASSMGWDLQQQKFEVVDTISGAVEALSKGRADYFMWERFMTKPLVDDGIFRRLGDMPTPWPCFVIAVRKIFMENHAQEVERVLEILSGNVKVLLQKQNLASLIADEFQLKPHDVSDWLVRTLWSNQLPSEQMLNNVQNHLASLSLIQKKVTFTQLTCAAVRSKNGES